MSNISEINGQLINAESSSFAATASLSLSVSGSLTGSLLGTASWATQALTASLAPNYVLTSITSSMLQPYVLTSQTSSMSVATASLALRASGSLTGSLLGTSSWASNAITASYVSGNIFTSTNPALSASYALTASFALNGGGGGGGGTSLGLVYAVSLGYIMP